jgi:hypothetical protein
MTAISPIVLRIVGLLSAVAGSTEPRPSRPGRVTLVLCTYRRYPEPADIDVRQLAKARGRLLSICAAKSRSGGAESFVFLLVQTEKAQKLNGLIGYSSQV